MKRGWLLVLPFLAAAPSSANYTLRSYDFVSGSGSPSSSSYQLQAAAGSQGGVLSSSTYRLPIGVKASLTAATPPAPTVTNPSGNYDQLKVVLNVSGFPTDTKYLIAASPDSFTTTYYVHADQTIGLSSSISDYQTYTAWGGASGVMIIGLQPSTTYQVKVAALQGAGTGSGFGPTAAAATVATTLTFAVSTSLTATPPFAVSVSMTPGAVATTAASIIGTVTTNAKNGGLLLIKDQNAGLTSTSRSFTIASVTADLAATNAGYGGQIASVSQTSGGPMVSLSPYNGTVSAVGQISTAYQSIASFASAVTAGSLTMNLLAKSDTSAPPANDYADTITLTIAPIF